jgi:hypothetical protein
MGLTFKWKAVLEDYPPNPLQRGILLCLNNGWRIKQCSFAAYVKELKNKAL